MSEHGIRLTGVIDYRRCLCNRDALTT